ncbi:hypothetical protein LINPERHAP1_LOCUS26898 [Linum perenne]
MLNDVTALSPADFSVGPDEEIVPPECCYWDPWRGQWFCSCI